MLKKLMIGIAVAGGVVGVIVGYSLLCAYFIGGVMGATP